MARASAEAAARTAQEILDSATLLLAERGFAEVSLEDVARAAGVTRGAVYHHYRSKAGVLRAVATELQSRVAQSVVEAAEAAGPEADVQLRAGSHAFLEAITATPVVRVLLVDAPAVVGWQEWRRLDAEHSGAHLRDALSRVGLDGELVEATAAQLSGAMNEAALWVAQSSDRDRARAQAHAVLDRFLDAVPGVRAPADGR